MILNVFVQDLDISLGSTKLHSYTHSLYITKPFSGFVYWSIWWIANSL